MPKMTAEQMAKAKALAAASRAATYPSKPIDIDALMAENAELVARWAAEHPKPPKQ